MLATATAETPRSARETLLAEQGAVGGFLQPDINLNAPRYFVQLGFQVISLPTNAIPDARMWRGEIVPCRTIAVVDNLLAIPETQRIPGSERPTGEDGRLSVASRRSYAYHEAERLLMSEDKTDRKNCLFEIKSLYSELGHRVYREIDLTKLFFPEWPYLPDKNEDVVALLRERFEIVVANPPAGIPSELQAQVMQMLTGIGRELIEAAQKTQDIQRQEILYTHQCMKLRPNEERYKPRYDNRDLELLARTGLPQIDAAELQTAESLNLLAKQASNSGGDNAALMKMVEAQQEQNALLRSQLENQNRMLEMLMAERPKIETEAPKAPQKGK